MCRLYGFRSSVLSKVHRSLVAAENALMRQSDRHPDGWGVAYYIDRYPHLIKNDEKALADGLFTEVSAVVSTRTLIAHIRQASVGSVNILNCHPFQHGPWTFAHNGEVVGYGKHPAIKEGVLAAIAPELRCYLLGSTDSEACFYLFLSKLQRRVPVLHADDVPLEAVLGALKETVEALRGIAEPIAGEPSRLTFMVTNGSILVGYRHHRDLYFSTHKTRCPDREGCSAYVPLRCEAAAEPQGVVNHLIVTSERIAENPNVWNEVPDEQYVAVDTQMRFARGLLREVG